MRFSPSPTIRWPTATVRPGVHLMQSGTGQSASHRPSPLDSNRSSQCLPTSDSRHSISLRCSGCALSKVQQSKRHRNSVTCFRKMRFYSSNTFWYVTTGFSLIIQIGLTTNHIRTTGPRKILQPWIWSRARTAARRWVDQRTGSAFD